MSDKPTRVLLLIELDDALTEDEAHERVVAAVRSAPFDTAFWDRDVTIRNVRTITGPLTELVESSCFQDLPADQQAIPETVERVPAGPINAQPVTAPEVPQPIPCSCRFPFIDPRSPDTCERCGGARPCHACGKSAYVWVHTKGQLRLPIALCLACEAETRVPPPVTRSSS